MLRHGLAELVLIVGAVSAVQIRHEALLMIATSWQKVCAGSHFAVGRCTTKGGFVCRLTGVIASLPPVIYHVLGRLDQLGQLDREARHRVRLCLRHVQGLGWHRKEIFLIRRCKDISFLAG